MKPVAAPVRATVPVGDEPEELVVQTGVRSGATMAVSVHSTLLGPALGGARLWHYERDEDGIADALRLARGMTFKAAAAGLDLGGGKGVICSPSTEPPTESEREALLLDFGDLVESLGGLYITAEDVGMTPQDMEIIATRTNHVTGLPAERGGAGDPSPFTAAGVQAAMRAAALFAFGTSSMDGRRIVVSGLGHVGEKLARGLAESGASLVVSDIDPRKRATAEALGARWVGPAEALATDCDILAPCAVGGAVNADNVARLRTRIVCGAANNQLADEALAETLAERGILYAPDFIANAGGLINVYRELHSFSEERAMELALAIETTMARILGRAERESMTPLEAARDLARERLDVH